MSEISEKEVDAFLRKYSGKAINRPIREAVRDGLEAAALARAEANAGEPVAWRAKMGHGYAHTSSQKKADEWARETQVQPLYAHPAPQPSGPVKTFAFDEPALVAAREIMELTNSGKHDDHLKAKIQVAIIEAIQTHFSALPASKPEQAVPSGWQGCATEGCYNPAGVYFERGGVGSHYCGECYLKVQALPYAPATKEER